MSDVYCLIPDEFQIEGLRLTFAEYAVAKTIMYRGCYATVEELSKLSSDTLEELKNIFGSLVEKRVLFKEVSK